MVRISLKDCKEKIEFVAWTGVILRFLGLSILPGSINSLINLASYGLVFIFAVGHWKKILYLFSKDYTLLLLIALAWFSSFWSVNVDATTDITRGFTRNTILGVYLTARYSPKELMRLLLWVFILAVGFSLIHGVGQSIPWRGAFPQKNYLARIMLLAAILFLNNDIYVGKKRWISMIGFIASLIVLWFSQGKTSFVIFIVSIAIVPLYRTARLKYKTRSFLYAILAAFSFIISISLLLNVETIIVDILGKDMNLNGRIPIWQLCIDKILERPWLGYGNGAFFASDEALYVTSNTWAGRDVERFNPHNGFIGIALDLGIVGMSLVAAHLLNNLAKSVRLAFISGNAWGIWMAQFMVFILIFNAFDNAGLMSGRDALWIIYVALSTSANLYIQRSHFNKQMLIN